MDVLQRNTSWPPSRGAFARRHAGTLTGLLRFHRDTRTPLLVNAYPYFAYREDKGATLAAAFALLDADAAPPSPDAATGLRYATLLDAMLDAVYSAMAALGFADVAVWVGETGWPTAGGFAATAVNAAAFTANLIRRAANGTGTPLRPHIPLRAYSFALFNENQKKNLMEQHFGIFYPNMTKVYPVHFWMN